MKTEYETYCLQEQLHNLIAQLEFAVERSKGRTTITKSDIKVLNEAYKALPKVSA